MVRYQVILAYDGTQFRGFQRQANARTVQDVVEQALQGLNWPGNSILAAGRTDTGVHATGQVIAFDLDWAHSTRDLQQALNANLPPDVVAREIRPVRQDFHPRFDALSRRYCYSLFCDPLRAPLSERYAWRVWPPVEHAALQEAASFLIGSHDFAAFGTPPQPGGSTIRDVLQAHWKVEAQNLIFEVVANAFLYHMVRRLVAVQVSIGQGNMELSLLQQSLQEPLEMREINSLVRGLAPAQGLVLTEVNYPPEIYIRENNLEI